MENEIGTPPDTCDAPKKVVTLVTGTGVGKRPTPLLTLRMDLGSGLGAWVEYPRMI